jgi:hypothetical protein
VLQGIVGFAWLMAYATALDGRQPYVFVVIAIAAQSIVAGGRALWEHLVSLRPAGVDVRRHRLMSVGLPVLAFVVFSTLFILANPDAVTFVWRLFELLRQWSEWFIRTVLQPTEALFWIAVAWLTAGLLQPMLPLLSKKLGVEGEVDNQPAEASLFFAFRNTLGTVIVLFTVYLAYEFYSLWNRNFPAGFYFAGYAHEGAAWLTVALALATLTLSFVFSGRVLRDPRLSQLRRLAWIWSFLNFLLSLCVYNRLFIYIDFNGMTRLRIVGLYGISVVVVGFLLVVWKIARGKNFEWLIQRQLWALAVTVSLYALTPVDWIAATYNVRRIQEGDVRAVMQIGVHSLDLEGIMAIVPLLDSSTPEIRQGVSALIAEQSLRLQAAHERRQRNGWTAFQWSDRVALNRFGKVHDQWRQFEDETRRTAAIQRFHDYAYQWY